MKTIATPVLVVELRAAGEGMPAHVQFIDDPDGREPRDESDEVRIRETSPLAWGE